MVDRFGQTIELGDEVFAVNADVLGTVVAIKEYYDKDELKYRSFKPKGRLCVEHYNGMFIYSWVKPENVVATRERE